MFTWHAKLRTITAVFCFVLVSLLIVLAAISYGLQVLSFLGVQEEFRVTPEWVLCLLANFFFSAFKQSSTKRYLISISFGFTATFKLEERRRLRVLLNVLLSAAVMCIRSLSFQHSPLLPWQTRTVVDCVEYYTAATPYSYFLQAVCTLQSIKKFTTKGVARVGATQLAVWNRTTPLVDPSTFAFVVWQFVLVM